MVTYRNCILATLIVITAICVGARRHNGGISHPENSPGLKIECIVPDRDFYEGEPVPITITLFSSTPDIAYANRVSAPSLTDGKFSTFQTISPAGNAYEKREENKTWYCFPMDAYMVTMEEKGKYEYGGGVYEVGVNYPVIVNDPFWGRIRSSRTESFQVNVDKVKFKVKSVPAPPPGIEYSGSVGNFTLETIVPEGDIFVGEEATAYIILRGEGMIAESTLPVYSDSFKEGVKLKSVSESREEGHDRKGRMLSEITLECIFIPTEKENAKIGEVHFDFFNPLTGKFEIAKSKPVTVKVKSTTSRRETFAI